MNWKIWRFAVSFDFEQYITEQGLTDSAVLQRDGEYMFSPVYPCSVTVTFKLTVLALLLRRNIQYPAVAII